MAVPTNGAGMDQGVRMSGNTSRGTPAPKNLPPGTVADPSSPTGFRVVDQAAYSQWHRASLASPGNEANYSQSLANQLAQPISQPEVPTLQDVENALAEPAPPPTVQERLSAASGVGTQGFQNTATTRQPAVTSSRQPASQLSRFDLPAPGTPGGQTPEEMGPAEVDRSKIDALLGNVLKATSGLQGIAESAREYSAAQAQLALGTAQAQQNSLALARSGNRRDAAALGARALQTNAELGAEATRSSALLRANEEDAERRLRMDAYKAAGDLGLNAAALEVDVNNLNMQAATNYLNQLFETNRLGMQLDEQQAQRVTNYIRDMALVSKDYYALNMDERQSIRDDLTRRYGIDKQLQGVMAQLDAEPGFWEKAALGLVSGAGAEASKAGFTALFASDERVKENVKDTTDEELEELLASVKAKTYNYKDPERHGKGRQFGGMAQDLEKTSLGAGMVASGSDGTRMVDGAKAGMAALAAVSLVYDKLKQLEDSL